MGSERLLVVVTGLPGSGKTTLARGLVRNYGFESRSVGDELARLYRLEHGLPPEAPVDGTRRMPIHKKVRQTDPTYFTRYCLDGNYKRRAVDGLRNLYDARNVVSAGGYIIALTAPQDLRIARRQHDTAKDADTAALLRREQAELDDPDINGAQALAVMGLAHCHGFCVNGSQAAEQVLHDTVAGPRVRGVEL
jgi:GTPase SAR1 family protein